MFDFIPLEDYTLVYFQIIFAICLFTYFHTLVLKGNEQKVYNYNNVISLILLVFIILYIGYRPLSGKLFGDMKTYYYTFLQFKNGKEVSLSGDIAFEVFLKITSTLITPRQFFVVCATLYVLPLYIAAKNWFPKYYFFIFLLFITSFSFWPYGTNGMRNGIATSLFILGCSFLNSNKALTILFLIISVMFHKSMMLPLVALISTFFFENTKKFFVFWIISILLSLTMGSLWVQLFASLGFGDDRLASYLTAQADSEKFSSTGFRFDFLIYSAAPLVLAYFYVIKKNFYDKVYLHLLHTYIICNAFWIMVIRANFSNRFAYLSWFLMAIIIGYPLFKNLFWKNQFKKVGTVILLYYGFTYIMFYVYRL